MEEMELVVEVVVGIVLAIQTQERVVYQFQRKAIQLQ